MHVLSGPQNCQCYVPMTFLLINIYNLLHPGFLVCSLREPETGSGIGKLYSSCNLGLVKQMEGEHKS